MKNIAQFFTEVRVELSRVTWPSYDEFVGSTLVALFTIILFAIYLGFLDRMFAEMIIYIFSSYNV